MATKKKAKCDFLQKINLRDTRTKGGKHSRSKAVEGKVEHEGMEVNRGALVSSLAEVGEHLLSLDDKDIAGVLAESADVEDMRGHLALPLPG